MMNYLPRNSNPTLDRMSWKRGWHSYIREAPVSSLGPKSDSSWIHSVLSSLDSASNWPETLPSTLSPTVCLLILLPLEAT
jgi:hypothetical protein